LNNGCARKRITKAQGRKDEYAAYLPLDEAQQREFEQLVATEPYKGIQPMTRTLASTWYEKGLEKGRRELLREQLEERFGALPPPVLDRLQQLPAEQLTPLGKAVLHAQSLRELGLED
jgi:Domain of unknown function (DUF4351)